MKQIRFSHKDYEKFRKIDKMPPFTAQLLQVFLLQSNDVTDCFREYDAKYYTGNGADYYPLNSRTWLVLLFEEKDRGLLFTTMRSANTSKLQYYRDCQGEEFEVVAKEQGVQ